MDASAGAAHVLGKCQYAPRGYIFLYMFRTLATANTGTIQSNRRGPDGFTASLSVNLRLDRIADLCRQQMGEYSTSVAR